MTITERISGIETTFTAFEYHSCSCVVYGKDRLKLKDQVKQMIDMLMVNIFFYMIKNNR